MSTPPMYPRVVAAGGPSDIAHRWHTDALSVPFAEKADEPRNRAERRARDQAQRRRGRPSRARSS